MEALVDVVISWAIAIAIVGIIQWIEKSKNQPSSRIRYTDNEEDES
jgi:hypothetical protein